MAENFAYKRISIKYYYSRYQEELEKTQRGHRYTDRGFDVFVKVVKCYAKHLIEELKQGVEVWLPSRMGVIQMVVYKSFLPINRGQGIITPSRWFHLGWRKREGVTYSSMYKVSLQEKVGDQLNDFYNKNPEQIYKLIQK